MPLQDLNQALQTDPVVQEALRKYRAHEIPDHAAFLRALQASALYPEIVQSLTGTGTGEAPTGFNKTGQLQAQSQGFPLGKVAGIAAGVGLGAPALAALGGAFGGGGASAATGLGAAGSAGSAGGGSMAGGGLLGSIGSVLSKGADWYDRLAPILGAASGAGAAGQRQNESLQLARDRLMLEQFLASQNLPNQRLSSAVGGDIIRNWTPAKLEWGGPGSAQAGHPARFSGGFNNPDLLSPDTRKLADDVVMQALQAQLSRQGAPGPTPGGGSSTLDKILGGAGLGSAILGGLFSRRPRSPYQLPTEDETYSLP